MNSNEAFDKAIKVISNMSDNDERAEKAGTFLMHEISLLSKKEQGTYEPDPESDNRYDNEFYE